MRGRRDGWLDAGTLPYGRLDGGSPRDGWLDAGTLPRGRRHGTRLSRWLTVVLLAALPTGCKCSEDSAQDGVEGTRGASTTSASSGASDAAADGTLSALRPRKPVSFDDPLEFLAGDWDGVRAVAEDGRSPGLFTRLARQSSHRFAKNVQTVTIHPLGDAGRTPTEQQWTLEVVDSGDNRIRLTARQGSTTKQMGIVVLDEDTIAVRYTGDQASTILKRRRASGR